MGESTCLMQPFSYVSGIPNEGHEGNPIHALGHSISFGRFTSESLAWERWSAFSHNRYVEEAERYSRPGSVAQKKAFFEAHYKKVAAQRAAALLEQANANAAAAASDNAPEPKYESHDLKTVVPTSEVVVNEQVEKEEEKVVEEPTRKEAFTGNTNGYNSDTEMDKPASSKVQVLDIPATHEPQVLAENSAEPELSSQMRNAVNHEVNDMELSGTPQSEKPLLKSYGTNQEASTPIKKKKTRLFTSSKSSIVYHKAPKVPYSPAKRIVSSCSRKDDILTPLRKKPATELEYKKRSTPKSLHKSVSFTPIRELSRLTSTVIRKIENSRVGASSSKTSKDCLTPLRTPTMVSKNEVHKCCTKTPCSEKRSCSKFLSACRNQARSPFSSAPFSLRTEERAASRKKKLEEKFNANEAQKVQVQRKLKEKEEIEIGKFRQTLCFKARPLPDFYKERKSQKSEIDKVPVAHHPLPLKLGKKPTPTPSVVEASTSLSPRGAPIKSSGTMNVQGKNKRTPTCSLISQSLKTAHENTSPNIQLG